MTPTGAVILKGLEAVYQPCPPLKLTAVGYGAGSRELPGHPNLLRIYLGEPLTAAPGRRERVLVLETHIDDMNPELYEPLMAGLFAAGALDVALGHIQMKKGRPAVALTVIGPLAARESLLALLFTESTTLGVRVSEVERVAARRWAETIDTPLRAACGQGHGVRRQAPAPAGVRGLPENGGGHGPAVAGGLPAGAPGIVRDQIIGGIDMILYI